MQHKSTAPNPLHTLRIASWNVDSLSSPPPNTLRQPRNLAVTGKVMNLDIIALQEVCRDPDNGLSVDGYSLWCSGKHGNGHHGVGFLVRNNIKVIEFLVHTIIHSDARAAQLIISTKKGPRSIYSLYAPHSGYGDDTIRLFWEEAAALPAIDKSIICVDANAHIHPNDWVYPAHHSHQALQIPVTNACGLHFLAFTSTLNVRPANLMPLTRNWEARHTFHGNTFAQKNVIDFILVPAEAAANFSGGAQVHIINKSAVISDHNMLVLQWTIKIHSNTKKPPTRPTMAPPEERDTDPLLMSPTDELYRKLFTSAQQLHPPPLENATQHHIKCANWVPPLTHIGKLECLIASLRRTKADTETLKIAKKRLQDAHQERRTKARTHNWGIMAEAFKRNDTRQAFRMIQGAKARCPSKRFTHSEHNRERNRFGKIYADPPTRAPILPPPELTTTYLPSATSAPGATERLDTFNPDSTHAVFIDGSYSAAAVTTSPLGNMHHPSRCGWAAYDSASKTVVFGSAKANVEHSANHGEALALMGAQAAFAPDIIITDSHHIESTTANLACEATDDMRHITNAGTWREIWRSQGQKITLIGKIVGHTGIIPNEISDVFAFVGASLTPGESYRCVLKESDIPHIASRNTAWNTEHKRERRRYASNLTRNTHPPLHFDDTPNAPRSANDEIPSGREIRLDLTNLNAESAPGPDGIRPRDLLDERIFPLLVHLIQEIWRKKRIPLHWLKSFLVGIPKPHDTITRGIALTATCLKVLTSIIRRRAAGFSLLSSQWGFRSHRGTSQATVLLREMLNRRSAADLGTTVIAIDLQKAFDSVRRDRIDKLLIEYGYGPTAAELVRQMYAGDVMYLYLANENHSDPIAPEKGVKQGCLLSSGIFNMFIDRALRVMTKKYPNLTGNCPTQGPVVLAYADDMAIVANSDTDATAFMIDFADVLDSYGLRINEGKTKVLRSLAQTHDTTQTETTYRRRMTTQEKFPGAWVRACVLTDRTGAPARMDTTHALLYMPSGNDTNLACSHCTTYFALTCYKSTPANLMYAHCKNTHLNSNCHLNRVVSLYGPPASMIKGTEHMLHRSIMTDAQLRVVRPLFLPPLRCGTHTFEAVEEIVYLGSTVHQNNHTHPEIRKRITAGCAAYGTLRRQTNKENIKVLVWLYELYVTTRLLFGTETWAQTLAQKSKLNSIRMAHLRTLTNNWYRSNFEIWGCILHLKPPQDPNTKCKECKELGTARFYYMRRFLICINIKRNTRILHNSFFLYRELRKDVKANKGRKATRSDEAGELRWISPPLLTKRIMKLITTYLGAWSVCVCKHENTGCMLAPKYGPHNDPANENPYTHASNTSKLWLRHEWLPLPTQAEIRKAWKLSTTEEIIERRRATLLGNLLRHNAIPPHDIAQNSRASWWKLCCAVSARMKVTLEDAHKISFWKHSIKHNI